MKISLTKKWVALMLAFAMLASISFAGFSAYAAEAEPAAGPQVEEPEGEEPPVEGPALQEEPVLQDEQAPPLEEQPLPEETAAEEEPFSPEELVTYTFEDEIVKIMVTAGPDAALGEEATLCAEKITGAEYEAALAKVKESMDLLETREIIYVPYDVYFMVGSEKVEPAASVKVEMSYKAPNMGVILEPNKTVSEIKAGHITDSGEVEIFEDVASTDQAISFDVDSFSPMGGIMVLASAPTNVYWKLSGGTLYLRSTAASGYTYATGGLWATTDKQPWASYRSSITRVVFENTVAPTSTVFWFYGLVNLQTIANIGYLDMSNVLYTNYMFSDCKSLTQVNTSSWVMPKLTDMRSMFSGCESLKTLDVSRWNTSGVKDMRGVFQHCISLEAIDVSGWRTGSVTSTYGNAGFAYMFYKCEKLKTVDVSKWDVSGANSLNRMFANCYSLETLDVSNWNMAKVTNATQMFAECGSLKSLDVSRWNTANIVSGAAMFTGCRVLENLDVSNWNTSKFNSFDWMFSECYYLKELNVSKWDTSKATGMYAMFRNCAAVKNLDVSKFNTANVTNMGSLFAGCRSVKTLDVSKFNTAKVTNMMYMFYYCPLDTLNLKNFNTSNVVDMQLMFYGCSSLKSLDISSFTTAKVTNAGQMFAGCTGLQELKTQKAGLNYIDLPMRMVEKGKSNPVYTVMPNSKTLVPYGMSFMENITDTTLVFTKTLDNLKPGKNVFDFGIYKASNGKEVFRVQNDFDGNIIVETAGLEAGEYYLQEIKGSQSIQYSTDQLYFTVFEEVTELKTSVVGTGEDYFTMIDPSLLTDYTLGVMNSGQGMGTGVNVYDSNNNIIDTLRWFATERSKQCLQVIAPGSVYINPTDAQINKARGITYAGPQGSLSDAIRCIFYFNGANAQEKLWGLFEGTLTIDTSKVNQIPADFTFAIIATSRSDRQAMIVPLSIRHNNLSEDQITTGHIVTRKAIPLAGTTIANFTAEIPPIAEVPIAIRKVDANGNPLSGAELHLTGEQKSFRISTNGQDKEYGLLPGEYTLRELSAPAGYKKADNITFTVKEDGAYLGSEKITDTFVNSEGITGYIITMIDEPTGSLTVSKDVAGQFADTEKSFAFALSIDDDTVTSLPYTRGEVKGTLTRSGSGQFLFPLAHGQQIVINELPIGTGYTVTELDSVGYSVSSEGETGVIAEGGTLASFVNTRGQMAVKLTGAEGTALAGATFEIASTDGTFSHTFETAETSTKMPLPQEGTYTLLQTAAPEGYAVAAPVTFEVRDGKVYVDGKPVLKNEVIATCERLLDLPITGGAFTKGAYIPLLIMTLALMGLAKALEKRRKLR